MGARGGRGVVTSVNATGAAYHTRSALPVHYAARRVWATLCTLITLVLGLLPPASAAAEPPTPEATMHAYRTVEAWVRAWSVPEGDVPEAPEAAGASVTLTLRGVARGRSSAWAATPEQRRSVLRTAVAGAIAQLDARLPLPNDLTRVDAARRLAADILISVELAGEPTPIEPATWDEVERLVSPGAEGVVVRPGAGSEAEPVFPLFMLTTGATPARSLSAATASLLGEGGAAEALREPGALRAAHGLRMAKFPVLHVAQPSAQEPPVFFTSGARAGVPSDDTASAASALIANLARRTRPDDSMVGTIFPARSADAATPVERALAAYVLARASKSPLTPDQPRALDAAKTLLAALDADRAPRQGADIEAGVRDALVFLAFDAIENADARAFWAARVGETVDAAEKYPLPAKALVAFAAVKSGAPSPEKAAALLRGAFAEAGPERLAAGMPWLALAEIALPDAVLPAGAGLADFRQRVWDGIIPLAGLPGRPDLAGGILVGSRGGLPTWQGVRPLIVLAALYDEPRVGLGGDAAIGRFVRAFRFVRSLQVDNSSAWMYDDAFGALGGVRAAPWDASLPPDATSLALLALIEFDAGIDRRLSRDRQPTPVPTPTPTPAPAP